jgi:two-component system, NarL family, nitrate/nitrite response regulator NarL
MRLLIVGEVRLYRDGLARLLGRDRELEVVGVTADVGDAVVASAELQPDVVLFSASASIGPSVIARVERAAPSASVIVIAASELEAEILAWAEAGVAGYVTREQSSAELRETIRSIGRGESLCSPLVSRALMRRVAAVGRTVNSTARPSALTTRETQVLELIERGLSNKEIAARLTIELATVKNHVHNILGKLGVKRRLDAAGQLRPGRVASSRAHANL